MIRVMLGVYQDLAMHHTHSYSESHSNLLLVGELIGKIINVNP